MPMREMRETISQALYSLSVNKLRSALTIMGVAVGVFSIIAVMTALQAIEKSVESGLTSLGANTFQIQKNPETTLMSGHSRNLLANRKDISWQQAQLFKKFMEGKVRTIGFIITNSGKQARYSNVSTNPDVTLIGGDNNYAAANGYTLEYGRNFSDEEIRGARNSIILGSEVAETLFPTHNNPCNRTITVGHNVYTIVGVFQKKGASFGQSQDNFVLIPITRYLTHIDEKSSIAITVEALSRKEYAHTIDRAIGAMRLARGLTVKQPNDFELRINESLVDSFRAIQGAISSGAFIISFMALLSAGVGIMNIMLVSVTERTREIGIRKSIGAPRRTILRQFLLEALFLSLAGGVIGIAAGVGAGNLVALQFHLPPLIPMVWIVVSLIICSSIGITFGLFPAWKAANLNPVDALRKR